MEIQVNDYPIDFSLDHEETARDIVDSLYQWAQQRDLIFLETQIDDAFYYKEQVPETPINDINRINCTIKSRSDIVISSINEGSAYCERVITFIDESTENHSVEKKAVDDLIDGIEWLLSILQSITQLLNIEMDKFKYRDTDSLESYKRLITLKNGLSEAAENDDILKILEAQGGIFSTILNILQMLHYSEEMKQMIINSIDSPDVLLLSLQDIADDISQQIENLEETAIAFQTGKDSEGGERLNFFIDYISKYLRTTHQIAPVFKVNLSDIVIDEISLKDWNDNIYELLKEIIAVMENNDYISLTDILEYEIKPEFEGLNSYIELVLKNINNE